MKTAWLCLCPLSAHAFFAHRFGRYFWQVFILIYSCYVYDKWPFIPTCFEWHVFILVTSDNYSYWFWQCKVFICRFHWWQGFILVLPVSYWLHQWQVFILVLPVTGIHTGFTGNRYSYWFCQWQVFIVVFNQWQVFILVLPVTGIHTGFTSDRCSYWFYQWQVFIDRYSYWFYQWQVFILVLPVTGIHTGFASDRCSYWFYQWQVFILVLPVTGIHWLVFLLVTNFCLELTVIRYFDKWHVFWQVFIMAIEVMSVTTAHRIGKSIIGYISQECGKSKKGCDCVLNTESRRRKN